jgi:hypothetical protein
MKLWCRFVNNNKILKSNNKSRLWFLFKKELIKILDWKNKKKQLNKKLKKQRNMKCDHCGREFKKLNKY